MKVLPLLWRDVGKVLDEGFLHRFVADVAFGFPLKEKNQLAQALTQ